MTKMSFKDISKLRLHDQFYEKTGMERTLYKVIKEPELQGDSESKSLLWTGVDETGEEVEFFLTEGMEHYGPEILA